MTGMGPSSCGPHRLRCSTHNKLRPRFSGRDNGAAGSHSRRTSHETRSYIRDLNVCGAPPGRSARIRPVPLARSTRVGGVHMTILTRARIHLLAGLFAACAMSADADAQWSDYPMKNVPRTKDGKVDLKAPPRRTPDGKIDLSGF